METITIKNEDLQNLSQEMNLLAQELTRKVKNELGEEVPANPGFLPKFHLNNLLTSFQPSFKNLEETRVEMVKKYGTPDPKNPEATIIQRYEPVVEVAEGEEPAPLVETESYKEFFKEFTALLAVEVEVTYSPFPMSIAEKLNTENFYPNFYKLVK